MIHSTFCSQCKVILHSFLKNQKAFSSCRIPKHICKNFYDQNIVTFLFFFLIFSFLVGSLDCSASFNSSWGLSNTGLWFACYDCNNTEVSQILQKQARRIATGHLGWNAVVTPSSWMGLMNLMITEFRSATSKAQNSFSSVKGKSLISNISRKWVIFSTNPVQKECSVGKYST